jgi:hypothetical protein
VVNKINKETTKEQQSVRQVSINAIQKQPFLQIFLSFIQILHKETKKEETDEGRSTQKRKYVTIVLVYKKSVQRRLRTHNHMERKYLIV